MLSNVLLLSVFLLRFCCSSTERPWPAGWLAALDRKNRTVSTDDRQQETRFVLPFLFVFYYSISTAALHQIRWPDSQTTRPAALELKSSSFVAACQPDSLPAG